MKLHQSGNKIIVTELNPMSDVKREEGTSVLLKTKNSNYLHSAIVFDGDFVDVDQCWFDENQLEGWLPMPVYDLSAKSPEERYEKLRKLNPRQFDELYARNLRGENFDKMVDEL